MVDIELYLHTLIHRLQEAFDRRLVYVGLQGSYRRGEANERSDIDCMVVLDTLTVPDMDIYREILARVGDADRACGFLCSREDLQNWNPCEICQLVHETRDYYGTLRELVPAYTQADIRAYIKISVGNLYHEIVHRYIHGSAEENKRALPYSYKAVFYILQNLYFLKTGEYALTRAELMERLDGEDCEVLYTAALVRCQPGYDFASAFRLLLGWCQHILQVQEAII